MAAFKSLSFPFVLTIWVAFYSFQTAATAAALGGSKIAGSWEPIKSLTDPSVVRIAEFAVAEHNQQPNATKLEFVGIIRGNTKLAAGLNYILVFSATEICSKPSKLDYYCATVYEKLGESLKLVSFYKLRRNRNNLL